MKAQELGKIYDRSLGKKDFQMTNAVTIIIIIIKEVTLQSCIVIKLY